MSGGEWAVKFFSKWNDLFCGYFDPINMFQIIQINNLGGDLSNISAKTATLVLLRSPWVSTRTLKEWYLNVSVRINMMLTYRCHHLIISPKTCLTWMTSCRMVTCTAASLALLTISCYAHCQISHILLDYSPGIWSAWELHIGELQFTCCALLRGRKRAV